MRDSDNAALPTRPVAEPTVAEMREAWSVLAKWGEARAAHQRAVDDVNDSSKAWKRTVVAMKETHDVAAALADRIYRDSLAAASPQQGECGRCGGVGHVLLRVQRATASTPESIGEGSLPPNTVLVQCPACGGRGTR